MENLEYRSPITGWIIYTVQRILFCVWAYSLYFVPVLCLLLSCTTYVSEDPAN